MGTKISIRKVIIAAAWVAVGGCLLTLLIAANRKKQEHVCKDVTITIKGIGEKFFIDKGDIITILKNGSVEKLVGRPLAKMNLARMEKQLEHSSWIRDAELYIDGQDVLHVTATERQPIARVFTKAGTTFYIDSAAMRLPILQKISVRVPVVTNFPSSRNLTTADSALLQDVKKLTQFINDRGFWNAQVAQIDIVGDKYFELIPTVGNHIIKIGTADKLEEKFGRLFLFYQQVLSKTGFDKYREVNVQYDGQVIGVYKGSTSVIDSVQLGKNIEAMMQRSEQAAQQAMDIDSARESLDSIKRLLIDTAITRSTVALIVSAKPTAKTPTNIPKTATAPKPNPTPKKPLTSNSPVKKPTGKILIEKPKAVMPKKG